MIYTISLGGLPGSVNMDLKQLMHSKMTRQTKIIIKIAKPMVFQLYLKQITTRISSGANKIMNEKNQQKISNHTKTSITILQISIKNNKLQSHLKLFLNYKVQDIIFISNQINQLFYYQKYQIIKIYKLNSTMGKKKIQKLTHEQKRQKKEQLKIIMSKLYENKNTFNTQIQSLTPITQINMIRRNKKKIQKDNHRKASQKKQESIDSEEEREVHVSKQIQIQKPKINIFQQNFFEVEGYQQKKFQPIEIQVNKELSVQDQARKKLGGKFNFQQFGLKQLKNKQETIQIQEQDEFKMNHPDLPTPSSYRLIQRSEQIAQFRKDLPILMKQQEIVETINHNLVTLICGQTGSGKSTQVPQFLFQKNYIQFGQIGITQPRRLAAIALAQRVSQQMNTQIGKLISYQVRHQRVENQSQSCIKFMTDGILLNQMSSDFLILKYGVIIIDQAHQRKVNTDLLIGLLSRVIKIRHKMSLQNKCKPLRLVIMSATMRVQDFHNKTLFGFLPPIIKIEARMFPVTTFFNKSTPADYVQEAVKNCVKIHKKLPPGDVLIFLTGKQQIITMGILLDQALNRLNIDQQQQFQEQNLIKQDENALEIEPEKNQSLGFKILHLYSSLPLSQQTKIFQPLPNHRKFIISTNISQTSLTIPNIRYVIDSGHQKFKHFDKIWRWYKGWGSRAMAQQRAGRAGRVAHGYCYRLYSTGVYANIMKQFPEPQINKIPLQNIILQLKSIGIQDILRFPFPTSPPQKSLVESINNLIDLKAVDGQKLDFLSIIDKTEINELGKILSFIPLEPLYAKMLLMGRTKQVPEYTLYSILTLTVETIIGHSFKQIQLEDQQELQDDDDKDFIKNNIKKHELKKQLISKNIRERRNQINDYKKKYSKYYNQGCDLFVSMNIIGEYFSELNLLKEQRKSKFNFQTQTKRICKQKGLLQNTMKQVYRNGQQIMEIYQTLTNNKFNFKNYIIPNKQQVQNLLDIFLITNFKKIAQLENKSVYSIGGQDRINLHPSSYLYEKTPLFLGYFDTFQTSRKYMKYPFVISNYKLLASFGKVGQIKDYIWDQKLIGLAQGQINGWTIPLFRVDVQTDIKYYMIGRFFLEGKIFNSMKALNQYYNADPKVMKIENMSEKVQRLANVLKKFEILDKQSFKRELNKSNKFLFNELKLWVRQDSQFQKIYQKLRFSMLKE